jgi:hypothetical protein
MPELVPADDKVATAPDRESWLVAMDRDGEDAGYFQRAGQKHWAYFADEAPTLLVGFETLEGARARIGQRPLLHSIARRHGWSQLTMIAEGPTFWRDPGVWAYFDRLVDDAFFEDFDRVLFYGAATAAYAAAAFSVAAPGARVLLLSPRATMAPDMAGWDNRDRAARRYDFTSRYGYAPDMIEGARHVHLLYDPLEQLDAMHAALYRSPHVARLPLPRAGAGVEGMLQRIGVLDKLIASAADGSLTGAQVYKAWRNRRDDIPYLKATLAQAAQGKHPARELKVCRSVTARLRVPRFARRLEELENRKG